MRQEELKAILTFPETAVSCSFVFDLPVPIVCAETGKFNQEED
jgi:hypothetical protein